MHQLGPCPECGGATFDAQFSATHIARIAQDTIIELKPSGLTGEPILIACNDCGAEVAGGPAADSAWDLIDRARPDLTQGAW